MQSCAQVKVDLASIGPPIVAVNHYRRGWDWVCWEGGREGGRTGAWTTEVLGDVLGVSFTAMIIITVCIVVKSCIALCTHKYSFLKSTET